MIGKPSIQTIDWYIFDFLCKKNVNEPETSYLLQVSNHIDLELKIFPSEDNHHKKMPLLELQMSRWL